MVDTARLRLRPWAREDFKPYHAILSEPAVHEHFGPEPMSEGECWRRMCAAAGTWAMLGFGGLAVTDRSSGRLIGNVGLFTSRGREFEPDFGDTPEMGWVMATDAHGQGLAREACEALLGWAEQALDPTPVWALVGAANEPSLRLADRLGFLAVGEVDYHGRTIVLKRPSW